MKDPPVDVFAGYAVHPAYDKASWVWDDLFDWLDAEARRVIPKAPDDARIALVAGASDEDATEQQELERHGFEHNRTFLRMQTDFASIPRSMSEPPPGISIRTLVPGADDEPFVRAHREAFADHYGHLEQPFETDLVEWRRLMTEDDFDPQLWLLACDQAEDTIAGFCIAYAEAPGDASRGLIDELGVRPAWRRRGIAQALLSRAFDTLRQAGAHGAVLTVDSKNRTGATTLYENVGMHSVRVNHTYVKQLRPGINLVAQ